MRVEINIDFPGDEPENSEVKWAFQRAIEKNKLFKDILYNINVHREIEGGVEALLGAKTIARQVSGQ